MSDVYSLPYLRVEQPRRGPSARSRYRILDDGGEVVAVAVPHGDRRRAEILRQMFPGQTDLDPRAVVLTTPDGDPLFEVDKAAGRMLITVRAPDGTTIGTYNTKHAGRQFALKDSGGTTIGSIVGDLSRRNFHLANADGTPIGSIRKRFAGIATHFFTTADKYDVEIAALATGDLRTLAVAGAIAMDLALHESKEII